MGLGRISDTMLRSVNQRADATCKQEHESPVETTLPCSYVYEHNELRGVGVYPYDYRQSWCLRCTAIECIISVEMYVKSSKTKITLCSLDTDNNGFLIDKRMTLS